MKTTKILLIASILLFFFFRTVSAQYASYTSEIVPEKDGEFYLYIDAGKVDIFRWNKDKIRLFSVNGRITTGRYGKNTEAKIFPQSGTPKTEIYLPETLNINYTSADGDIEFHDKHSGKISISISSGNINIGDLNNSAEISTGGGDIRLGNIKGDLKIYETVGNIKITKIIGKANISTSGGDIIVQDAGSALDALTKAGKIEVGNVGGNANITNRNGNIEIQDIRGNANINSIGGAIILKNGYGDVNAETTGGDVVLGNVHGSVNAKTAGGKIVVNLYPDNSGKSIIVSGIGDIFLNIPSKARPYIHARIKVNNDREKERINKNGLKPCEIRSDFNLNKKSFQLDEKTTVIEGKSITHSGKETIYLETTNSNIEIRKMKK